LLATCSKCHEEFLISSCNKVVIHNHDGKGRPTWAYNAAAAMGQMATARGHSSLEEILAILSVQSLTKQIFTEIERCLGTSFEQLLLELVLKLEGKKNRLLNKIIPIMKKCQQLQYGGWSKGSHKHSYNTNSGMGIIFGAATKKLLYVEVRNKYCAVCSNAKSTVLSHHKHTL